MSTQTTNRTGVRVEVCVENRWTGGRASVRVRHGATHPVTDDNLLFQLGHAISGDYFVILTDDGRHVCADARDILPATRS